MFEGMGSIELRAQAPPRRGATSNLSPENSPARMEQWSGGGIMAEWEARGAGGRLHHRERRCGPSR
ncbi:hypothetical protein OK006_8337 [Actinobacteria bacterium OK006]|nr:hypothetical protein OK006_8337 [Actinobacteria bacterium OK006]